MNWREDNHSDISCINGILAQVDKVSFHPTGFGRKLVNLLEHGEFCFSDAHALKGYRMQSTIEQKHPTWHNLVRNLRNKVMHQGYVDFDRGGYDFYEAMAVAKHLKDILVRIILKKLGYDSTYQPCVSPFATSGVSIDWVKKHTHPRELGYLALQPSTPITPKK